MESAGNSQRVDDWEDVAVFLVAVTPLAKNECSLKTTPFPWKHIDVTCKKCKTSALILNGCASLRDHGENVQFSFQQWGVLRYLFEPYLSALLTFRKVSKLVVETSSSIWSSYPELGFNEHQLGSNAAQVLAQTTCIVRKNKN